MKKLLIAASLATVFSGSALANQTPTREDVEDHVKTTAVDIYKSQYEKNIDSGLDEEQARQMAKESTAEYLNGVQDLAETARKEYVTEGAKSAYREAYQAEIDSGKGNSETARIAGQQAVEAFVQDASEKLVDYTPIETGVEPTHRETPVADHVKATAVDTYKSRYELEIEKGMSEEYARQAAKEETVTYLEGVQAKVEDVKHNRPTTPVEEPKPRPDVTPDLPTGEIPGPYTPPSFERSLEDALLAQGEKSMEYHNNAMATTQATVNARPIPGNGGTAFGAGVGFAGDSEAISVGFAQSFRDTGWSASATLTGTSEGSYVESEVSAGAGVQYSF